MSTVDERAARLAAETEKDYPESWRPEPGDVLVGEYLRRDTGTTAWNGGTTVPILVLTDKEGKEWGVWVLHAVLRQQLAEKRPKTGELVAIRYEGKREGASGNAYHSYRVAVDREPGAEWDVAAEPGDEQATEDLAIASAEPTPADDDIPF